MTIAIIMILCFALVALLVWCILTVASWADDESEYAAREMRASDTEQLPDEPRLNRMHPSVRRATGRP